MRREGSREFLPVFAPGASVQIGISRIVEKDAAGDLFFTHFCYGVYRDFVFLLGPTVALILRGRPSLCRLLEIGERQNNWEGPDGKDRMDRQDDGLKCRREKAGSHQMSQKGEILRTERRRSPRFSRRCIIRVCIFGDYPWGGKRCIMQGRIKLHVPDTAFACAGINLWSCGRP